MKVKRVSLLIISLLVTSTLIIGCTQNRQKEVVFESNVAINNSSNQKVTQEIVDVVVPSEDDRFEVLAYKGDEILGHLTYARTLYGERSESTEYLGNGWYKPNIYSLDKNTVNDTSVEDVATLYDRQIVGLSNNIYESNREVYYYDRNTNERVKVGELLNKYRASTYGKEFSDSNYFDVGLVPGNEDYGYIIENYGTYYKKISLQLIDLKNNKTYLYKDSSETASYILSLIYSEATKEFYVLKDDSSIYELTIKDKDIKLDKKVTINQGDLKSESRYSDRYSTIVGNENGEICIYKYPNDNDNGNNMLLMVSYNPGTNKVQEYYQQQGEKNSGVYPIKGTDLVLLQKWYTRDKLGRKVPSEYYLGRVNNGKIDIYHKIDVPLEDGEELYYRNIIANEDGTEVFLQLLKYVDETNISDVYLKLKIQ